MLSVQSTAILVADKIKRNWQRSASIHDQAILPHLIGTPTKTPFEMPRFRPLCHFISWISRVPPPWISSSCSQWGLGCSSGIQAPWTATHFSPLDNFLKYINTLIFHASLPAYWTPSNATVTVLREPVVSCLTLRFRISDIRLHTKKISRSTISRCISANWNRILCTSHRPRGSC
jgi:hypothetical protein